MMEKVKVKSKKEKVTSPCRQAGRKSKKFFCNPLSTFSFLLVLLPFAFLLLPFYCCAQPVSSIELINNAKQYDGKLVVYEGEVIGDIMARGDYAWINVNDGNKAIGIWAPAFLLKDITYTGSYKARGDGVEITGIFRRACPEHGGDLDIHAQAIRKIGAGRTVIERLNIDKRNQAIILSGVLCLVWILSLFIRK
jgi:hypothetical protein